MSDYPLSRVEEILEGTFTDVPLSRIEKLLLEGGGGGGTTKKIIVDVLPTTDIDPNAIYMVPGSNPETDNLYDEYMHVNGRWELMSSADIGEISDETINDLWGNDSDAGYQEDTFED